MISTIDPSQQIANIIMPTGEDRHLALQAIITFIDLTTLSGTDTDARVQALCATARNPHPLASHTAAVCVYPPFAATAKAALAGSAVRVAAVAGAFPSGQSFLPVRVAEVEATIAAGADEIDMVISRGAMLTGERQRVYDEVATIKAACAGATLKVILETGELSSLEMVADAAQIAIDAGADFIKTSTGMAKTNATLEVSAVMLNVIQAHFATTGRKVGFKPAGGIRSAEQALAYYALVRQTVGEAWLTPQLFRFGASSLLKSVVSAFTGEAADEDKSGY